MGPIGLIEVWGANLKKVTIAFVLIVVCLVLIQGGRYLMYKYLISEEYTSIEIERGELRLNQLKNAREKENGVLSADFLGKTVDEVLELLGLDSAGINHKAWIWRGPQLVDKDVLKKPQPIYSYRGAILSWEFESGKACELALYFGIEDQETGEFRTRLNFQDISIKKIAGLEYLSTDLDVYEFIGKVPLNMQIRSGRYELWGELTPPRALLEKTSIEL